MQTTSWMPSQSTFTSVFCSEEEEEEEEEEAETPKKGGETTNLLTNLHPHPPSHFATAE